MKSPNDAFLRTYPRRQAMHECISLLKAPQEHTHVDGGKMYKNIVQSYSLTGVFGCSPMNSEVTSERFKT